MRCRAGWPLRIQNSSLPRSLPSTPSVSSSTRSRTPVSAHPAHDNVTKDWSRRTLRLANKLLHTWTTHVRSLLLPFVSSTPDPLQVLSENALGCNFPLPFISRLPFPGVHAFHCLHMPSFVERSFTPSGRLFCVFGNIQQAVVFLPSRSRCAICCAFSSGPSAASFLCGLIEVCKLALLRARAGIQACAHSLVQVRRHLALRCEAVWRRPPCWSRVFSRRRRALNNLVFTTDSRIYELRWRQGQSGSFNQTVASVRSAVALG